MWPQLFIFSAHNKRLLLITAGVCCLWSGVPAGLWFAAERFSLTSIWWPAMFVFAQLYLAAQTIVPALLLEPEHRSRGFYLFWLLALAVLVWLANRLPVVDAWPLSGVPATGLLLFTGTLIGVALARYVKRLWEILPLCLVMMLADFSSWAVGPTAEFAREIEAYYLDPVGPPPLIDMVLVKFAYPGAPDLVPVFGVSDWIMVVFFAAVARRYRINDNLLGPPPSGHYPDRLWGRYLPISAIALFVAIMLAHASGSFIPALPLMALAVIAFYLLRTLPQKLFRTKS